MDLQKIWNRMFGISKTERYQEMLDKAKDTGTIMFLAVSMDFMTGGRKFEQQIIDKLDTIDVHWALVAAAIPDIRKKSISLADYLWEKVIQSNDFDVWPEVAKRFPWYDKSMEKMMALAKTSADWKKVLQFTRNGSPEERKVLDLLNAAKNEEVERAVAAVDEKAEEIAGRVEKR